MLKQITLPLVLSLALLLPVTGTALAAGKGTLVIEKAQARASMGKMPHSAAFLQMENRGKSDDALLSASSPAAERVEIHSMSMEGDVMKMRAVERIELKAGEKLAMQPGQGYHLMLMGLKKPLKAGEKLPLTLTFREAGKLQVSVEVVAMGAAQQGKDKPGQDKHEHHDHHDH